MGVKRWGSKIHAVLSDLKNVCTSRNSLCRYFQGCCFWCVKNDGRDGNEKKPSTSFALPIIDYHHHEEMCVVCWIAFPRMHDSSSSGQRENADRWEKGPQKWGIQRMFCDGEEIRRCFPNLKPQAKWQKQKKCQKTRNRTPTVFIHNLLHFQEVFSSWIDGYMGW